MSVVAAARRTQEQRRAETQAKILDAAIESLLEFGYAQTTTRRVAALAGVSPGAIAYHYPRRVELVATAIERLTTRRIEAWRAMSGSLPERLEQRVPVLIDLVWEDFSGPLFSVFVKAWVAAADDPELHARLALAERGIARAIGQLATESVDDEQRRPGWEGRLLIVLAAVRGLALTERFEPRVEAQEDPWPAARVALIELLGS